MISRRSFLKLSGLAVGALGAGFGTGHVLGSGSQRRIAMHAFVPDDERAVADLLRIFRAELPDGASAPQIAADSRWHGVVRRAFDNRTLSAGPVPGGGQVSVRIVRVGGPAKGDVLVYDDRKRIHDPSGDFSMALHGLRTALQGRDAQYMVSAEYADAAPFAGLLSAGSAVVIENERGVQDRIALDGRTRTIDVRGPQGRTGITITERGAHVHAASCRHELCRQSGMASHPGDVIACAPNRVLLRVERA